MEKLKDFDFWANHGVHPGCSTGCNEEVDDNTDDMEDASTGSGDHEYDDDP
ncbi:MAG: hypothetical protein U9M89_01630 [Patescibacteria group bacterium]|nr:hypothetical protein [Patescibacteria group bacterium]